MVIPLLTVLIIVDIALHGWKKSITQDILVVLAMLAVLLAFVVGSFMLVTGEPLIA